MSVKLIVGAPGVGKTTYAQKLAQENDGIVVDLDEYRKAAPTEEIAQKWRLDAENAAHSFEKDVYVVRTLADAKERAEAAERIKADETIVLMTSPEIAKKRVTARDGDDSKHEAITQWWNTFKPNSGETTLVLDEEITPEPKDEEHGSEDYAKDSGSTESDSESAEEPDEADSPQYTEESIAELLEQARLEERNKVASEYATKIFDSNFTSAALSRGIDEERLSVIRAGINPALYVGEGGELKSDELNAFFDALAPAQPKRGPSNHAGYRNSTPISGKEHGKAMAEEFLNKGR
ncbi:AAA family ATPase [Rothia terrae]|uniref:AAA family ATPase n=1 Tax=Rothia terrae TaxID=396015 RepID=UPI0038112E4E